MKTDQFLRLLEEMPQIVDKIESELYTKLEKALRVAWTASVAQRVATLGISGLALMDICEKTELSQKRIVAFQAIREALKPVIGVLESIQVYYLLVYQMAQVWDTIPTWDEYQDYVQGVIEKEATVAMQAAIPALIERIACGTKFQLKANYGFKSILNEETIITLVMINLKTVWDTYDQDA